MESFKSVECIRNDTYELKSAVVDATNSALAVNHTK
jgi:hypothetical protein